MYLKGGNGIENSVDPDQTAWAVWSGSTLFAWICLSKNWGALWYSSRWSHLLCLCYHIQPQPAGDSLPGPFTAELPEASVSQSSPVLSVPAQTPLNSIVIIGLC